MPLVLWGLIGLVLCLPLAFILQEAPAPANFAGGRSPQSQRDA
jgi:hypothetical protein